MGLIKRNEVYYLRIMIDGTEYRRSLHTKNKTHAKKLYDQWIFQYQENKIKRSNFIPLISIEQKEIDLNRPSLKQAFREHLRVSKGNFVGDGSLKIKELLLEHLNAQNIQWDNIIPERMLDFQEKLRLEYAPSTVDKFITHIKAFLKFAVKRNYFDEHDRVRLDFYKRSKPKKAQKLITDSDLQAILKYCKDNGDLDFMYYIMALFFTASRPNEIIKMTINDIDFENLRVTIYMNKTKRHKHVAFDKQFLDELIGIMRFNELTNGCIFLGSCRYEGFYARKFKKMKDELNFNEDYTLYSFRRTAATKVS